MSPHWHECGAAMNAKRNIAASSPPTIASGVRSRRGGVWSPVIMAWGYPDMPNKVLAADGLVKNESGEVGVASTG